jgi:integrase
MSRARGTGSLFRRAGCTTWTMQYYVDGRRIREKCETTDYNVAQRMLTRKLYQISQGELVGRERRPARVEELWLSMVNRYKADGRLRAVRDLGTPVIKVPGQPVPEKLPPQGRWTHIGPEFGQMQARRITTAIVTAYQQKRREKGAKPASINREVGALKHCLKLAVEEGCLQRVPAVRMLRENNTRTGFIEDEQFTVLCTAARELWLRAFLELGFTYGWRYSELLKLTVGQLDFKRGTIRLEVGTTKNKDGREVVMTSAVRTLLQECCAGKRPADRVLTRPNWEPVCDFRWTWRQLCVQCGLGHVNLPRLWRRKHPAGQVHGMWQPETHEVRRADSSRPAAQRGQSFAPCRGAREHCNENRRLENTGHVYPLRH